MKTLRVQGGRPLRGQCSPPPDKSVAHRALWWAAMAQGPSLVTPWDPGQDVESTRQVLRSLGVSSQEVPVGSSGAWALQVDGVGGPSGLRGPSHPLDCGNSGSTMRLSAGFLAAAAGQSFELTGDASLRRRPMERLRPLERMGAKLQGPSPLKPPFRITGHRLNGASVSLDVASAQVKGALLSAGLWATGPTRVQEPGPSRDHTERGLSALGVRIRWQPGTVEVDPLDGPWEGRTFHVPPDFSSAAFLLGAAWVTDSPEVSVRAMNNPTRTGFLDVLEELGAQVEVTPEATAGPEPVARFQVRSGTARGVDLGGAVSLRALDELPLVAGLCAFLPGASRIRDAAELRVKESDRIDAMHQVLTAFGVGSTPEPDGLIISGGRPQPADVDAAGDHRVAMTAVVMGLGVAGVTRVRGAEVMAVSYPGFVTTLQSLGADLRWEA